MGRRVAVSMGAAVCAALGLFILAGPYLPADGPGADSTAATIRAAKTTQDLYARYTGSQAKRVNILIVPGHEPGSGGAEYKNIRERDIVVDIANELVVHLRSDPALSVMVARDGENWHPILQSYFDKNWEAIRTWRDNNKVETARLEAAGLREKAAPVIHHNTAPEGPSVRLNGINKWADENDIDIVLHLHINDYPRSRAHEPGNYSGFALYIPYPEYGNSAASRAIAEKLYERLTRYYPVSDLAGENTGIVEEAKLIAIGRDNSQSAASVLIEYGYLYEPQFADDTLRAATVTDLAYQTFAGVQDFFNTPSTRTYASTILPYTWSRNVNSGTSASVDVLALQTALVKEGVYPPPGNSFNECPRSGTFGTCTEEALKLFQQKYGIEGDGTVAGPATRAELNAQYGEKIGYQ